MLSLYIYTLFYMLIHFRTIANYIVWRLITKQFITMEGKFNLMKLQFRKVKDITFKLNINYMCNRLKDITDN